ncbi:MAG: hypothetical protein ACD_7C00461G0003 [uncultured bacterium]|nr:MAG: hypothetical protein ACD_7C00461G0003 [uncultured bacterium]HBR79735.1 hypothetical protein [Candidatus Moranbacteria bacterium]
MKKVFIISSVLLFLVGSFYIAYNLFLAQDEQSVPADKLMKNDKKTNLTNLDKMVQLVGKGTRGLSLSEDGEKIQYYSSEDRSFWTASFDGKSIKNKLSNDDFNEAEQIIWNKNKKEAILKIKDSFYLYSFGNKEKLIKNSKALNWINFYQKIVYTYEDQASGKKTLNISDPDGSNWKEIAKIEDDKIYISDIPRSAKASFWLQPDAFKESNLTIIPFGEGELEKKGELKFGADYLWSKDGGKFLRSSVSQKGGSNLILEVCDIKTNDCLNLNFPTMVDKCVWTNNNKSVYCAMPVNIENNLVMPNGYLNNKIYTKDLFWKINIESAKKEKIIEEKYIKQDIDATNLLLSPNEDFLFFIDRKSEGLFRILL